MQNVKMNQVGNKLIIEIDLAHEPCPVSKTGKTLIVASTGGFVRVGGVSVNLNVVKPK